MLRHVHAAMTSGYSTLLIHDNVLPNVGCSKRGALSDMIVMNHTGCERSEKQWRTLLGKAGFEVQRIWRAGTVELAILECEPLV